LHRNNQFVMNNCLEPTTQQYVTTNGSPTGSQLLMAQGDTILVTIKDTLAGVEADLTDQTLQQSGSMVASGANGFVHNANTTDCTTQQFNFRPMFATASPGRIASWTALGANVSFASEIGHWELCGDANCNTKPDSNDADDTSCLTVRGIGGCIATDSDNDGVSYQTKWPDGNASHPSSITIGSPNSNGVGPLSASATNSSSYIHGYNTIGFRTSTAIAGTFYPFFSAAGTGRACTFNFGNDISGTTTNDFSKTAQYGTTRSNPCFPDFSWLVAVRSLLQ
jgi:hypothetical protein